MFKTQAKSKNPPVSAYYLFLALIIFVPACSWIISHQLIIGTIVNSILFLSTYYFGIKRSFIFAFIPSLIVLALGTVSFSFFYFIPFIMISNCLLMIVFSSYKKHLQKAFLYAMAVKSAFLFGSISFLLTIMAEEVAYLSFSYGVMQAAALALAVVVVRPLLFFIERK